MTAEPGQQQTAALQLLATLNELNIKAFNCKKKQELIFLMLNDTAQLIRYDRAVLFSIHADKPKLIGVSGQSTFSDESDMIKEMSHLIGDIINPKSIQVLNEQSFSKETERFKKFQGEGPNGSVVWMPVLCEGKFALGFWIERWQSKEWKLEELNLLSYISRGYSAAWQKFISRWQIPEPKKFFIKVFSATLVLLLCFIPVPLRVVAPCEVVAKDPYLITAPLNGIVEEILVKPGEEVKEGQALLVYDDRVALQELKVAQKQVDIAKSQLDRVMTQGYSDPEALSEAAIRQLQLDRDNIKLDLAEYQAGQLEVESPVDGVVAFDNPDEWRGKPVQIGERIMVVVDPDATKIKIWLSESDNIQIMPEKPIKVFLNIDPAKTYRANLVYIADFSILSEKGVSSFTAEANWVYRPDGIKIGLKGSAILYGEYVPLFYWVLRKPWNTFREIVGV